MYLTKTLAIPRLDETDCMKIVALKAYNGESAVYGALQDLLSSDELDITDDELLTHICIRRGAEAEQYPLSGVVLQQSIRIGLLSGRGGSDAFKM